MDMDKYWKIREDIENLGYWCQIQNDRSNNVFIIFDQDYQVIINISGHDEIQMMEQALQGLKNLANPTG